MDHSFWHKRWDTGRIGFHVDRPNPLLLRHFASLALAEDSRIFVPLCGKTLDIAWLLSRGHRVVGIELSELAIVQLFQELDMKPGISGHGPLKLYSAPGIDIFVGDFFALGPGLLGPVDAIFDRAALIALPKPMRAAYANQMVSLDETAAHLLICLEYEPGLIEGPPFSVGAVEVRQHYAHTYEIDKLECRPVDGGFKGVPAQETVWRLTPRKARPGPML